MNVFVTGATGFIGTKLVNRLIAQGHTVHALSRSASNRQGLDHERVRLITGDILDKSSLLRGMQGCEQVYHLAAYAKNWAPDKSMFYRYNLDGMKNVFDAAREGGIKRIVYTSTVVTLGPTPLGVVGNEEMPRMTSHYYTDYEASKVEAEQQAATYVAGGLEVVIVNPTRVYGPGKMTEGNSVSLMIDMYDRGRLPALLNHGKNIGNYVLVDDLVEGHLQIVNEVSGKSHLQFSLAPQLGLAYSKLEELKAEWLGFYPKITPGWVETYLQDWAYTCEKAERELGYRITPLKEGIRRTYDWILQQRRNKA
jgi:farnesol dehydrogenase